MAPNHATFNALRAISAIILRRLVHPVVVMVVILFAAAYVLTILLTLSFSAWWLLLLILLLPLTLVAWLAWYGTHIALRTLFPHALSDDQQHQLDRYVNKLLETVERAKTPYPILLILIGKDVARKRESEFLRNLIGDSKELMKGFSDIQGIFR